MHTYWPEICASSVVSEVEVNPNKNQTKGKTVMASSMTVEMAQVFDTDIPIDIKSQHWNAVINELYAEAYDEAYLAGEPDSVCERIAWEAVT